MLVKQQPEICISALLAILLDCKSKLKVLSSVFAVYIHTTFRTTCMFETVTDFLIEMGIKPSTYASKWK